MRVIGVDWRTASPEVRAAWNVAPDDHAQILRRMHRNSGGEVLLLSTCNRTEIWSTGALCWPFPSAPTVQYEDIAAFRRLARVCAGLESAVLGETEIVQQIRRASDTAREAGTMGPALDLAIRHALAASKRIRTETGIARGILSYAGLGVRLASERLGGYRDRSVLILGAGEMAERVLRELRRTPPARVVVQNRTLGRAQALVSGLDAVAELWTPTTWDEFDAVFGAVSTQWNARPVGVTVDLGAPAIFPTADFDLEFLIERTRAAATSREDAREQAERILDDAEARYLEDTARRAAWRLRNG